MKGKSFLKDTMLVPSTNPVSSTNPARSQDKDRGKCRKPENDPERKETPEAMIRSLQSVFCKGRYHSWRMQEG
jgi:hypothetical protein